MSNDEKPPMPPQPTTVAIERPPAWAIAIAEAQAAGFASVDRRLDGIEVNQEIQGDVVRDLAKRVTAQGERIDKIEGRQNDGSMRVRAESATNMEQDAALAQVFVKVGAIESKVDAHGISLAANTAMLNANTATTDEIKKAVSGWLKEHPTIGIAIAGLIMTAITWAQSWLTAKGHP